jgi:hypothetical protein
MSVRSDDHRKGGKPGRTEPSFDGFLSYSTKDVWKVSRIQRFLQRTRDTAGRRLQMCLDRTHLRGGELGAEIGHALARSRALVVCCSRHAADSKWVEKEIREFRRIHEKPRIALILLDDDPRVAIPDAVTDLEIRYHDLRRGLMLGIWVPGARDELLRLAAWLSDADLSTLINWDRRRVVRNVGLSAASVAIPAAGILEYVAWSRRIGAADLTAQLTFQWTDDEGVGAGSSIERALVNNAAISIRAVPASAESTTLPMRWPATNRKGVLMSPSLVELQGRELGSRLQREPSTAGVWFKSIRTYGFSTSDLGLLARPQEWDGAKVEVWFEAYGLGVPLVEWDTADPVEEDPPETRARDTVADAGESARRAAERNALFDEHYSISTDERAGWSDMDYQVTAIPLMVALTLDLQGSMIGRSEAIAARVWGHDEDVRDLHVAYMPPFTTSAAD